ncbi:Transglycosylase associated protein [Anatilimnocola aggregata]|uniref:Transglycosylase associated protein n=1 Tax=Anatilimnocola aggregata TaxID=2528021 RepID=A0A517YHE3_9BACT|nr:GlsB/YeaQ/YmgE family stress response membrane protein [Anatilimnocola aggregata]QDU29638.1 Transglycosylase associated protein [Anatilimnocola aggregata]
MSLLEILLLLLVAGVCGSLAQAIVGYSHGGCLVSIVLGLIGALLGTYLARALGMGDFLAINFNGRTFPIIWSIIGATLFVAVLSLISRRRPMV